MERLTLYADRTSGLNPFGPPWLNSSYHKPHSYKLLWVLLRCCILAPVVVLRLLCLSGAVIVGSRIYDS